jgi:hypothetical protein
MLVSFSTRVPISMADLYDKFVVWEKCVRNKLTDLLWDEDIVEQSLE